MKHFELVIRAKGSLLIGGGETPDGVHGSQLANAHGRPYLPASALRGALRETLEALLRGCDLPACEGGFGHTVGTPVGAWKPCDLQQGGPCDACRLFGGTRHKVPEGAKDFSALVLGDGEYVADDDDPWMVRPGVAVARAARSAADDRLFFRRTTKTAARFKATGWLRDDTHADHLAAAARATTHVGAGRSRGLARVELDLRWVDAPVVPDAVLQSRNVRVRLTLKAPATLGVALAHENLRDTRREIPGTALRGAIGFALAAQLEAPDEDPAFTALVTEDAEAPRYGFLTPIDDGRSGTHGALPITQHRCKTYPNDADGHGRYDDLFDRIATALLERPAQVRAVYDHQRAARCGRCKGPLRSAHGHRGRTTPVPTQVATRASIERRGQSVREGALFTEVMLAPGTSFEGTIRNVPSAGLPLLATVPGLPLSIGRARGAGRGRVEVSLVDAPARSPLEARASRFVEALRAHLRASELDPARADRLVSLTLLSPMVLHGFDESSDEVWSSLLSLPGTRRLVSARRFTREGTWDQRAGTLLPLEATAAGAVYVLELPEGASWRDCASALDAIELRGIGGRTHQGYGEVVAFDPIHLNAEEEN